MWRSCMEVGLKKTFSRLSFFALLLLAFTLACNTLTDGIFPTPTSIDDVIPFPVTNSPVPTRDTSLPPRWMEFERALASVLLGPPGNTQPEVSQDHGLCEWEFWGQKGEQIYVWAECQANVPLAAATSTPAIIFLDENGHIKAVVMPDEGWGNIQTLFPEPVLSLIYSDAFDAMAAMNHIELRRNDPSIPPMIVEQGTEMPMP